MLTVSRSSWRTDAQVYRSVTADKFKEMISKNSYSIDDIPIVSIFMVFYFSVFFCIYSFQISWLLNLPDIKLISNSSIRVCECTSVFCKVKSMVVCVFVLSVCVFIVAETILLISFIKRVPVLRYKWILVVVSEFCYHYTFTSSPSRYSASQHSCLSMFRLV